MVTIGTVGTVGAVGSIYDTPGWCLLKDDYGIATTES